jgi:hypothetical protein
LTTATQALKGVDLEKLAQAVRQVLRAVTDAHTSDCLLYAHVGVAVLEGLGIEGAKAVAGSAVWRLGPGDGDVMAHAFELHHPMYAVKLSNPALPFHAWIELPGHILDFTTWTLRDKARMLDQLDGGTTTVEWAPDVLLAPNEEVMSVDEARMAEAAGAFAYVRHTEIEEIVNAKIPEPLAIQQTSAGILIAYKQLLMGITMKVMGVNANGELQSEPPEQEFHRIL